MNNEIAELLNYRANSKPFKSGKERIYVAWPMLAYRVIAPKPREKKLNLFEEVILKLSAIGISTIDLLSDNIPIDRDLIAYIFIQMKDGKGLIDEEGKLTHIGKRFLEDLNVEPEMVTGYVFRDGLSGNMLPYFIEGQLSSVTISDQYHDKRLDVDILKVDVGTENKPRNRSLKVIRLNPDITKASPYPREVLRSIKMYNKKKIAYNSLTKRETPEGALVSNEDELYWLDQIDVQNIDPKEIYISTYIFVPDDNAKSSHWQICDPFGLGISSQFRMILENNLEKTSLSSVVNDFIQMVHDVRGFEIEDYQHEQKTIGQKNVFSRFGKNIFNYPILYQILQDEDSAWRSANKRTEANVDQKNKEISVEKWYRSAYDVIEIVLKEINEKIPALGSIELISKNQLDNADNLTKLADKIGFKIDQNFTKIMQLKKYQIERAVEGRAHDLQSLMALALISANDNSFHPLYELAKENDGFMNFLLVLKELRDKSSHADQHYSFQIFENERKNILEVIYMFFVDLSVEEIEGEKMQDNKKLERKIRNLAEINVFNELERSDLNYLDLSVKSRLVNMEHHYILEDKDISSTYRETVIEGARTVEELLKYWHHHTHRYEKSISDPIKIAEAKILSVGFVLEDNNTFPEPLRFTEKKKIISSIKYSGGTLGAMLIAYVIKAEENILKEMAEKEPNLIYRFNDLIKDRGHSPSGIKMNKETIKVFRENIYAIMKLA